MARREVTCVKEFDGGDILAIGNNDKDWSPVYKSDAIEEIESPSGNSYYVDYDGEVVDVEVVEGEYGKYLRTDPDNTHKNNLDSLPTC